MRSKRFAAFFLVVLSFVFSGSDLIGQVVSPPRERPQGRSSRPTPPPTAPTQIDMQKPFSDCKKLTEQGFWKEALDVLVPWTLNPEADASEVGPALQLAIQCFFVLNRHNEVDDYREKVVGAHSQNRRLLQAAAESYIDGNHHGFLVGGVFERGQHRGGGEYANAFARDRVRAFQLMQQAAELVQKETDKTIVAEFYFQYAQMWKEGREGDFAWQFQILTDLSVLPDYDLGGRYYGGYGDETPSKAPVDADGNPIVYDVPSTFEEAKNDGERWRWCLAKAAENDPARYAGKVLLRRAGFERDQFGVQTMVEYSFFFRPDRTANSDKTKAESGTWALHTLGENETIAKLASGVKRFALPEGHNYIKLYQEVLEVGTAEDRQDALEELARIFENRRQYPKSLEYWNRLLKEFPLAEKYARDYWQEQADQIAKNWGRFEPTTSKVSGKGAELQYLFRNGKSVTLTAYEIKVPELLGDIKTYLKTKPREINWDRINIDGIGYDLVAGNLSKAKYLGREVARWVVPLEPAGNHFDRRTTITTPMVAAGAYLLKAKIDDGNTDYIVVWLNDTGIVRKQLNDAYFYYIADAQSGAPVPNAQVEFFGYQTPRGDRTLIRTDPKEFVETSDPNGQLILGSEKVSDKYQWLLTATTPDAEGKPGRFAYLGFSGVWYRRNQDPQYNEIKAYFISDRPVYRPNDTAHYKFWVGTAKYDAPETAAFAGQEVLLETYSPRGERLEQKMIKLDNYGGLTGEMRLPENAMLGDYRFNVFAPMGKNDDGSYKQGRHYGSGSFRVEEYKKPEYEVSVDAPSEPVALGEPITATIRAKYYFGAPVVNAKVKYKIVREKHDSDWYPIRPWDWFYGNGYWWFAYDCPWYPGWNDWGCVRPIGSWFPRHYSGPPEVIAEREVEIGAEGTVEVRFETAFAKEVFPNDDQKYTITAEVVDQSRRTILGSGSVLLAKEPFKVYTWVNRGYYEPNQQIRADFLAKRLDGKPVGGAADVRVFKISYSGEKNTPKETEVHSSTLNLNEAGTGSLSLNAGEVGQYRISCKVKDAAGHVQEGGYIFSVYGPKQSGSGSFAFNALELIPDKPEYAPGDQVELRINANRPDSTVLLFLRPSSGVYLPPQTIRMQGKSESVKIPITLADMPNIFVEALCISDGRTLSESKELVVPPEKRILNVEVIPSAESYKPGEKAKARLVVTDQNGKPVVGQTVVSIYDKSVEYIAGGPNLGDSKSFFWKWRRHFSPQTFGNLERYFHNMTPPNKPTLQFLGVFGASVVDEIDEETGVAYEDAPQKSFGGAGTKSRALELRAPAALPMEAAAPSAAPQQFKLATPQFSLGMPAGTPALRLDANTAALEERGEEQGGPLVEATVRKEFADTALWVGALETDAEGTAEIELAMPENLTTWKINVWAMGLGTKVGYGKAEVLTRKDLIIRMQTPRFLVQKDQAVLTANVHNYLKTDKNVRVSLELEGPTLVSKEGTEMVRNVAVSAGGEARVDWTVDAKVAGSAVIRMKALTNEESDAIENSIPVYVHGMLKQEAQSGYLKPEATAATLEIKVPEERRPEETKLTVRFSPTLAGAMIDALPYLVDYPYGCTEQTLNRFLPTVITQKILIDANVDLAKLEQAHANLNAQELGDPADRAKQWGRKPGRPEGVEKNPVYSREKVRELVEENVRKLTEMQLSDGGWGWFSGYGEHASAHLTALIVRGLALAQSCDVVIEPEVLRRGVDWLKRYQTEQIMLIKNGQLQEEQRKNLRWKSQADALDALVYLVLAETSLRDGELNAMKEFLYTDRTKLSLYAVGLLGLALEREGDKLKAGMCKRMLEQYLVIDEENQTAYLNLAGYGSNFGGWRWWCWYDDEFETQACFLKLLVRLEPKSETAPKLVKYLLNNRKHATYWNSTRDTAVCIEAFAEFLRASGEDRPNMTVEILFDGEVKKTVAITPENMFSIDNTFVLEGEALGSGGHKIDIRKQGTGPLYFNSYLQNFTLEDPIAKTGLEVKIERRFYKLERNEDATQAVAGARGQVVDLNVEKDRRIPLADLSQTKSGDRIEVELLIESKNDYESLLIEDFKAAGCEAVELRSGYNGNPLGAYVEFRDNRVTFFVYRLARGKHSVSYQLRAEQPGRFSALPAKIEAMYAPELKANSDEFKLGIED